MCADSIQDAKFEVWWLNKATISIVSEMQHPKFKNQNHKLKIHAGRCVLVASTMRSSESGKWEMLLSDSIQHANAIAQNLKQKSQIENLNRCMCSYTY